MPGRIFGYEKQVHTGRNGIEDFLEVLKGVILGPAIWVRGNTVTVYSLFPVLYLLVIVILSFVFVYLPFVCRNHCKAQSARLQLLS